MRNIYLIETRITKMNYENGHSHYVNKIFSNMKAAKKYIEWRKRLVIEEGCKVEDIKFQKGFCAWYEEDKTLQTWYITQREVCKEYEL